MRAWYENENVDEKLDENVDEKIVKQKHIKKKKSGDISCYVVVSLMVTPYNRNVRVEFETYEKGLLISKDLITKKYFELSKFSESKDCYNKFIERAKKGRIRVKYSFEFND